MEIESPPTPTPTTFPSDREDPLFTAEYTMSNDALDLGVATLIYNMKLVPGNEFYVTPTGRLIPIESLPKWSTNMGDAGGLFSYMSLFHPNVRALFAMRISAQARLAVPDPIEGEMMEPIEAGTRDEWPLLLFAITPHMIADAAVVACTAFASTLPTGPRAAMKCSRCKRVVREWGVNECPHKDIDDPTTPCEGELIFSPEA